MLVDVAILATVVALNGRDVAAEALRGRSCLGFEAASSRFVCMRRLQQGPRTLTCRYGVWAKL